MAIPSKLDHRVRRPGGLARLVAYAILAGIAATATAQTARTARTARIAPAMQSCYDGEDLADTKACRMQAWATYQALQVAQVKYGLRGETCQFGSDITGDDLVDRVRVEARQLASQSPYSTVVTTMMATLSPPSECPFGVAKEVGGLKAGALLDLCTQEQKAGSGTICQAWMTAARAALNGLSGREGASNFFCSPADGLDAKSTAQLLADEVARDTKTQARRPAAEVLAEALARQFPCVPPKSEDAIAIFHRALEIFEAYDGKVTAWVAQDTLQPALRQALKSLRPVVSAKAVPATRSASLPKGYVIIESLKFDGRTAELFAIVGPGALAGTLGAAADCGLRYSIAFSASDGTWRNGGYSTQQCSPNEVAYAGK